MPLTITRAQRDAIYEVVVTHLTGIGDVWISVDRREFATAKRLGRAFAEDLRLLEDLGWAETIDRETVTLTVPPDELTRTLARLHKDAAGSLGTYVAPEGRRGARRARARCVGGARGGPQPARPALRGRGGVAMTVRKSTSEEAVVEALASQVEPTSAEIATATGLGRSTVGKTLAALERAGMARRSPGGRDGRRRLPDRWAVDSSDEPSRPDSSTRRLRPGQLDRLVLDYINSQGADAPVGPTAVAKALGRSAGRWATA